MAEVKAYLATRLRRALGQLPHLLRALSMVWAAARPWTVAWAFLLVAQGLLPIATVYLTKRLVDSLVLALDGGGAWQSSRPVLIFALLMVGVSLVTELLRAATVLVRAAQSELLQDHIRFLIQQKSVAADLAFYEWPEYYDHLHRAREEASYRPVALVDTAGGLFQNGITLVAMGAVLLPFGLCLPAALLLSTLPAFYVVLRYTMLQHRWRMRTTSDERRTWYYDWVLTDKEPAAELRLFDLSRHFQRAYQSLRGRLRRERLALAKAQSLAELCAGTAALSITGATLAWMIWRALNGQITLGELALFYQAFNQGQRLTRTLLENVGQLYANSLFLGNLFEFLSLEPKIKDPAEPLPAPADLKEGARFRRVTFSYPGSQRPALEDFDLKLPAARITAVVGQNGAGKSTLVKLLCRLYDPERGSVEVDGTDVRDLSVASLRRLITVMFQEPVRYSATVAENISLGDLPAEAALAEIEEAASAAGADPTIRRLPEGYDSLLGKWFAGGTELSVGEWQRIALARAFLRRAPIIVLDEPTSAMDPWAEADWLDRFRRLASGRTAVIITHRFTTAMRADVIHVMEGGRIVESGSHTELLERGGRYAQSWFAQTQASEGRVLR